MLAGSSHEHVTGNEMRIEARAGSDSRLPAAVELVDATPDYTAVPVPDYTAVPMPVPAPVPMPVQVAEAVAEAEAVVLGAVNMAEIPVAEAHPVGMGKKRKAEDPPRDARTAVNADDALARLEVEAAAKGPSWRITQKLVLQAPWDATWKAGSWVGKRKSQGAKATSLRQKMTPEQRERLAALPYGVYALETDEALDRLEEEAAAKGPAWRVTQKLELQAPWDEKWKAGVWVMHRTGNQTQAVQSRARMTPEQRIRFEALPTVQRGGGEVVQRGAAAPPSMPVRSPWRIPTRDLSLRLA